MVNIIIISEMRVGSRWLHYLLRDLLGMQISGEIDVRELPHCKELIKHRFQQNRIVKFHHATPEEVLENLPGNYKIIGIVRNPRDRIVSWAFHQRYKPPGKGMFKDKATDNEAVEAAFYHELTKEADERQLVSLMEPNKSTAYYIKKGKTYNTSSPYIWTSYHWLKTQLFRHINAIVDFLGVKIKNKDIMRTCLKHTFKGRTGRDAGEEKRNNEYHRKGIEDDHMNWFTPKMMNESLPISTAYWLSIGKEDGHV